MNEEIPFLPLAIGALGILYVGYEIERQRHKLRQIFNLFDREESEIAALLETMVESGELKPYVTGAMNPRRAPDFVSIVSRKMDGHDHQPSRKNEFVRAAWSLLDRWCGTAARRGALRKPR